METVAPTARPERVFHWADYITFGIVLAIALGIGIFFSLRLRGKRVTAVDVLLGGRRMSMFPVSLSILATFLSTVLVLTVPAETFFDGVIMYRTLAYIPATIAVAHIFVPIFHRMELISTYEYLGCRFNTVVRSLGSATFIVMMLLVEALSLYVPAQAFSTVAGVSLEMSILGAGLVSTVYTALGGLRAVVWTDVVHVVGIVAGMVTMVALGSSQVGGIERVLQVANEFGRVRLNNFQLDFTDGSSFWSEFIGGGFLWLGAFTVSQGVVQRCCCMETCREAQGSLYIAMVLYIGSWTVAVFVGLTVLAYFSTCEVAYEDYISRPSQLLPFFIMDKVAGINGLPGLLTGALFGSVLGTVSSAINSLAAVTLEDVVKPIRRRFGGHVISPYHQGIFARIISLFYGLLTIGLAYLPSFMLDHMRLYDVILSIFGVFGGPLLGVFILGALFPIATSMGATLGLLLGLAVLLWMWIGRLVCPNVQEQLWNTVGAQSLCVLNGTEVTPTPYPFQQCFLQEFYDVSWLWYTLIGTLVTCVVGVVISFFTCDSATAEAVDPILLCCGKKKYRQSVKFVAPSRIDLSHLKPRLRRRLVNQMGVLSSQYHDNALSSGRGFANPVSSGDKGYGGMGPAITGSALSSPMSLPQQVPTNQSASSALGPVTSQSGVLSGGLQTGLSNESALGVAGGMAPRNRQWGLMDATGEDNLVTGALHSGNGILTSPLSPLSAESSNLQTLLSSGPGFHYPQAFQPNSSHSPGGPITASNRSLPSEMTSLPNTSGSALW